MAMEWTLTVWAIILTSISFILVALFGTRPLAIALVWVITRIPGHSGATCPVYFLEPIGPWPGVCEKACRNPPGSMGTDMVGACYFLSGQTRDEDYESKNN